MNAADSRNLIEQARSIVRTLLAQSNNSDCREWIGKLDDILCELEQRAGKDPPYLWVDLVQQALALLKLLLHIVGTVDS